MKIKKYVVEDVKEALKQIKYDLGEDAVILQTRKFKKGGFLGLGSKLMYEVTAVAEDRIVEDKPKDNRKDDEWIDSDKLYQLKKILAKNNGIHGNQNTFGNYQKNPSPSVPSINSSHELRKNYYDPVKSQSERQIQDEYYQSSQPVKSQMNYDDREYNLLKREILGIKRMMQDMTVKIQDKSYLPGIPENFRRVFQSLLNQEISEDISKRIVESLRIVSSESSLNSIEFEKKFGDIISPIIKTDNPLKSHKQGDIIFFVGPTGVGKTTTLTKIAAMLTLELRKKIGILTIDTYRIAAVDQLKTSADIMGIQVGVSYNPGELKTMLEKFKNYDLILVDTAGRSQNNEMQMSELKRYMELSSPQYVFLTGSMNTRISDLRDILEHFSVVSPTHLILTKMDETRVYGSLIEVSNNFEIPISFVTNGQRIPEDIMIADPRRLGSLLVREVLKDARSDRNS